MIAENKDCVTKSKLTITVNTLNDRSLYNNRSGVAAKQTDSEA